MNTVMPRGVVDALSGSGIEIWPDDWPIAQDATEQIDAEEIGHVKVISE